MKELEHQIWGKQPNKIILKQIAAYEPHRWQWAMKYKKLLEESGYTDVEIIDTEVEDGTEEET